MDRRDRPHVLIVVQNLPVPFDRRVWRQARAVAAAGLRVSVICPRGSGQRSRERLDGVDVYRYRPVPDRPGKLWYVAESAWAWLATAAIVIRIHRHDRIDVLQACNPPDTYAILARALRPFGVRFAFDQHDLSPELYVAKFGRRGDLPHRLLLALERHSYRAADHVIVTNASHREIALVRGGVPRSRVTVVRNGPEPERLHPVDPDDELRRGRRFLCCYVGMMGPQDGVDHVVRAAADLVHRRGRRDIHVALLGDGQELPRLRALAARLDVQDHLTFTGLADDHTIRRYLSTADLGLSPEPPDDLNDISTMIKVSEYLTFGLPVVAFDLRETRRTAGHAAVYVRSTSASAFAGAIEQLLDDRPRRQRMGRAGQRRVHEVLAWRHQRDTYVDLMSRLAR